MTSRAVVGEHVAAFNAHDRERLLAGLAPDVVWSTGSDTLRGHAALAELFDDGVWALAPALRVVRLVADDDHAAGELVETLTVDGVEHTFPIACFFDLDDSMMTRVKVFREDTADLL